jgi:hypothetical protein
MIYDWFLGEIQIAGLLKCLSSVECICLCICNLQLTLFFVKTRRTVNLYPIGYIIFRIIGGAISIER